LATAWHAHEIFVKYDAIGHKTGALTFRVTVITRAPKKSHHTRAVINEHRPRSRSLHCNANEANVPVLRVPTAGVGDSRCSAQMGAEGPQPDSERGKS
jgi:hypothetical protein